MASREARNLATHLGDGALGLHRRRPPPPSERLRKLFHAGPATAQSCGGGRYLQPVSSEPNVYLVHHFFSESELEHMDTLITERRAAFKMSKTDDGAAGSNTHVVETHERTSASLFLPKAGDPVLRTIEERAAQLVGLPADFVEPLQVVTYTNGQRFDLHHDLGHLTMPEDAEGGADGGAPSSTDGMSVATPEGARRLVTLFVYLNTLPDGVGHTEFPTVGLSVRPRSGTALLFCNVDAAGEPDVNVCHRACPVPPGHRKFGVNLWIADCTMQAHAVSSLGAARPRKGGGGGGGKREGGGLLAALLQEEPAVAKPPPAAALHGLAFRKEWPDHGVFTGRVVSAHPTDGYLLRYDEDGDEEHLGFEQLAQLPLLDPDELVGRHVSKHFIGFGRHAGTVTATAIVAERREYTVRYDDGDAEDLYHEDVLRILSAVRLKAPKPKPKRKRAAGGGTKAVEADDAPEEQPRSRARGSE